MRAFLVGLLLGLLLGLALPAGADIIGAGWRGVNDGFRTYEPALPSGANSAVARVTSLDPAVSPGTLVYVQPSDGTNACEGRFAARTAAGLRCIDGVVP